MATKTTPKPTKAKAARNSAWRILVTAVIATVMMFSGTQAQTTRHRIGAVCNDGTTSKATGSGACSHHGGVNCWQYSDGTCTKP
jgi:hypothetical protein